VVVGIALPEDVTVELSLGLGWAEDVTGAGGMAEAEAVVEEEAVEEAVVREAEEAATGRAERVAAVSSSSEDS